MGALSFECCGLSVPGSPDWAFDFDAVSLSIPAVAAMHGTPHDPVHHMEGCPWVHTRMVCDELVQSDAFRSLGDKDRAVAFLAAVFHDVGKPATTEIHADGRVTQRGHSALGARMARDFLWRAGFDPVLRERVCAAVQFHQVPMHLINDDWSSQRRGVIRSSLTCGNNVLYALAAADARGRVCRDPEDRSSLIDMVDLFRELAIDQECLDTPFPVPDGETLRVFMASPETIDPSYSLPRDPTAPTATLMSGLPGSGKTTWISQNMPDSPVVSLDALRDEFGVKNQKDHGRIVQIATERTRELLRTGVDFAFDATNLTNDVRGKFLSLFKDYRYRTRIVACEVTPEEVDKRFSSRGRGVPADVMKKMLRSWRYPPPWEADERVVFQADPGFVSVPATCSGPGPVR